MSDVLKNEIAVSMLTQTLLQEYLSVIKEDK
jgi:hypothetical protein